VQLLAVFHLSLREFTAHLGDGGRSVIGVRLATIISIDAPINLR